ncbi:siderophore-interacting protein [Streptomyces sp. NPDC047061]|uniref:siderophore-interacting protein n=1 Tax=Streptomyces sp. NPDC047061 TaxID=3154605 RepID=UPI0033EB6E44
MKRRLMDRLFVLVRVANVELLGPRLRKVTLTGPALAGADWTPGQHVRVQVAPSPAALDWLVGTPRTCSVWECRGESLELIVFDHGQRPGARWACETRPGDELILLGPTGTFTTRDAPFHLFAGEETAQVAFGPMMRALPAGVQVFARLETQTPSERLAPAADVGARPHWDIDWVYREGRSAASSQSVVDAVAAPPLPEEPGVAYLAGEARTIQLIRRHLVEERGWSRRQVRTKPFWAPGRKGLD